MDLFYDRVLGVSFWDYSHLPLNLHGRVCLLFSFFWGILGLIAVRWSTLSRRSWSPASRRRSPSPPPCSWRWTSAFPSLCSARDRHHGRADVVPPSARRGARHSLPEK